MHNGHGADTSPSPGLVVLFWTAMLAAVPIVLLVTFTAAYIVGRGQVCRGYERQHMIDCGGTEGYHESMRLSWTYFALLVAAELLLLGLAIGWTRRSARRRTAL